MMPPGQTWFRHTASALAYALAQPHEVTPELGPPHNDLTRFILDQHARMPDYLRGAMHCAALGFDCFGLSHGKRLFHQLPLEARIAQIASWKNSGISFQRDLIRYFESLATLGLYSRGAGAAPRPNVAPPETEPPPDHPARAQIVVVGSGPGGAITACLLAEAGREVLLIEEGDHLPLTSCPPFSREEMDQKYRNGGQTVAMGRNKIAYVEGRCVGGGSEINSGLYHRTPPEILEHWRRDYKVEQLQEQDLLPHFEACERAVSVSLLPGAAPSASLKLQEGAVRLGWKALEVPRWFKYDVDGSGRRQSMTETFIPRFLKAGGRLLPDTRVLEFRQAGRGWLLQARSRSGVAREITAENLFLCAGAVQTPALLRRSGITLNVGDSLQVHPTIKLIARFPEVINAAGMGVPVHQVKEFAPQMSFGCSISSPPYIALGLLDHPGASRETSQTWQRTAIYYAMIRSEGSGRVRNFPGYLDPLVRYELTIADRRHLATGLRRLARLLLAAGATELYPSLTRGPALRCEADLSKLPDLLPDGLVSLMTIHLFSSCPMGEAPGKCATDSFGRVHGFRNLCLNDASLLCSAPGVNPQGSVMAIARRNALHFLDRS